MQSREEVIKLCQLGEGEMFRRPSPGKFRYIKSSTSESTGSCYRRYYCYNLDGDSKGYFMPGNLAVVRICPDLSQPAIEDDDSPFYMCYVQGSYSTRQKHDGPTARQEAERLAKLTGKNVFVLRTVACVTYTPPPTSSGISWKRLGKMDC